MKNKIKIIKKLRKITKIGIYKCKKILDKYNYNIKKCIKYFHKKKLIYKSNNIYKFIKTKTINNISILILYKSETDFIIKNYEFNIFNKKIIKFIIKNYKKINLYNINKKFNKKLIYLTNKLKENITIKDIFFIKGKYTYSYNYNNKIGVIIKAKPINKKININLKYLKLISVHIAALNPKYIKFSLINKKKIKKIKKDIIKNYNSCNNIKHIVKNKLKKNCLYEQFFIYKNKIKIKYILKKINLKIIFFKCIKCN